MLCLGVPGAAPAAGFTAPAPLPQLNLPPVSLPSSTSAPVPAVAPTLTQAPPTVNGDTTVETKPLPNASLDEKTSVEASGDATTPDPSAST